MLVHEKKIKSYSCQGREFTFSGHMLYQHIYSPFFFSFFFRHLWEKCVTFGKVLLFHFDPGATKRCVIYGEVKHSEQTFSKFVGV